VVVPALAEVAASARAHEADDDAVAGHDVGHLRAHLTHDARGLVAVHGRETASPVPLREGDVAVTDRAGGEVHRHLAGGRSIQPQLLDLERRPELAADRGLHGTGGNRDCWSRTATSMVFARVLLRGHARRLEVPGIRRPVWRA
jgi:hypothetical protein